MDAAGQPADGLTVEGNVSMSGTDRGAQHTILHAKGNGVYEGRVNLEMPGSWDVDLTATKDDKRGRQRLTVEVVGSQGNQGNIQPRNPNEGDPEP
jgi:nitrogen fixation protein FixH